MKEGKQIQKEGENDIMNEEDVMETSIMHLCIPDYEKKEKDGLIVPSGCSLNAVSMLLNEKSDRECVYHFPVYDINDQPSNVVIIRNLPSGFNLESADGDELENMIENVRLIISINQAISNDSSRYGVVRVTLNNSEYAVKVAEALDGQLFHNMCLHLSVNAIRPVRIPDTSITSLAEEKENMRRIESSGDGLCSPSSVDTVNERETGVTLEYDIRSHGENVGESEWRKVEDDRGGTQLIGSGLSIEYMNDGVIVLNEIGVLIDSNREDVRPGMDDNLFVKSENEPSILISDGSKEQITVTPETFYHGPQLTTSPLHALENTTPPEDSRTRNSQE